MRKKQLKNRTIAVAAIFFVCTVNISAQVNIGTIDPPHAAAVLDLSQKEAAAPYRGLLLPRVSLTDPDVFQLITDADDTQKSEAAGMVVYNFSQCDGKFAKGVYAWTGTKWVQLTNNPVLIGGNPVLTFDPVLPANNFIEIPSGQDLRTPLTAYTPEISYTNASSVTGAWANTIPNASNGLVFSTHALEPTGLSTATTASPYSWTTSPISDISIWPEEMTSAEVTTNPFLTRESTLTIKGIAGGGPCPGSDQPVTVTVTLNQTNYAIVPDASLFVLRNANQHSQPIRSNAKWQATASAGSLSEAAILDLYSYTNTPTGSERHDGLSNTNTFNYTSASGPFTDKKYETAQITFSDVDGRAKPVTINVMQCQGTPNLSGITTTATDNNDSDWQTAWGTNVVKHSAKPNPDYDANTNPDVPQNIYEEFVSADFGAAGRWMTTNLAAWKYDEIYHSTDPAGTATSGQGTVRTLSGPVVTPSENNYARAQWCYPGSSGTSETDYNNNPHLGLLYTWDAATAGKGGELGTSGSNEGGSNHASVQGVCPKGWHLPSDYEWTELENAIIKNTTSYAHVSANIDPGNNSELLPLNENSGTSGYPRGSHGPAMKEVCGVNGTTPNGLSNKLADNGFSVLLTGIAGGGSGSGAGFGTNALFWSSSSYDSSGRSWYRELYRERTYVLKQNGSRATQLSVRCKKDVPPI
jgi:uncharacterized protein (TIGR02145 family)